MPQTRQLRKKKTTTSEPVISRSTGDRIAEILNSRQTGEDLTEEECIMLIDYIGGADRRMKAALQNLQLLRGMVFENAKKHEWKELAGEAAKAKIKSNTPATYGDATALAKILKKLGKIKLFNGMVKPSVTQIKKTLGESVLRDEGFMKDGETTEYYSLTISAK